MLLTSLRPRSKSSKQTVQIFFFLWDAARLVLHDAFKWYFPSKKELKRSDWRNEEVLLKERATRQRNALLSLRKSRAFLLARIDLISIPIFYTCSLNRRCTDTGRFPAWRPIFNIDTWCIARRFWTSATCFTYISSDPSIFRHRMRTDANSIDIRLKFHRKVSAINAKRFRFQSILLLFLSYLLLAL